MAKKKIRIGVVGIGGIGNHHASVIAQNPAAEVAAIFDSSEPALERAHGNYPAAAICKSFKQLLDTPGLNAVVIGTPNNLHAEYTIAAAKKKLHVLCEKPLAMNPAESRKMLKAVKDNNLIGMTNFSYRWVPSFRIVRDMIKKGQFGNILRVHVMYLQSWLRDPNGPLVWRCMKEFAGFGALGDLGSHMIDAACFVTGAKPKRAIGTTQIRIGTKVIPGTKKRGPVTTDTNAQFMVDFGPFCGTFETTQVEPGYGNHHVLSIGGEKASCKIFSEDSGGFQMIVDPTRSATSWVTNIPRVEVPADFKAGGPCANDFILAIQGKLKDYPTFEDGHSVQGVLDAVYRSTTSNKWESIK